MASPVPRKSPVPKVPAILGKWSKRFEGKTFGDLQLSYDERRMKANEMSRKDGTSMVDIHLYMTLFEPPFHKIRGSNIQWKMATWIDLKYFHVNGMI
jgi:hypothetical protein